MRLSIAILIFLILFNGWAGLMQQYHIDDQLGISAETGNPVELRQAQAEAADETNVGSGGIIESITGVISSGLTEFEALIRGLNPGVQMLSNILPPGVAQSLIAWLFGVTEILVTIDLLNYARGVA